MTELTKMTVCQLQALLQGREVSSVEITQAFLERIYRREEVGAFLTVCADLALSQAEQVDNKRASGQPVGPLAGIPVAIKDNICTQGVRTTCASRMLSSFIPPYQANVVQRLYQQGVILLGKTNMDEFAMGSTTETSFFFPCRNPHCLACTSGGSSGGSAAAVADGQAPFALGSDTGGSVRQPASFCGVVGIKPTYGLVSRYGLIAFASSLDQIGPITRTVEDSALILQVISGWDSHDSTSHRRPVANFSEKLRDGVEKMRFALPKEYFHQKGINGEVKAAVLHAADCYKRAGAQVEEVSIPSLSLALPAYYLLSSAEASSNLSRYDGIKYGYRSKNSETLADLYSNTRGEAFGTEVKRRILLGTFVLSSGYYQNYYKKAMQARAKIAEELEKIWKHYDIILSPVAPTTAFPYGFQEKGPVRRYLEDIYTVPANLAGIPAISLPCGKDKNAMPIGVQLMGPAFSEPELYRAAYCLEQEGLYAAGI